VIVPLGVIRPIAGKLGPSVNQRLPSGPGTISLLGFLRLALNKVIFPTGAPEALPRYAPAKARQTVDRTTA
jgi:hypothetical protein